MSSEGFIRRRNGTYPANPNIAASVRARLLNVAKAQGVDFNQVLVRILYRLTQSRHADRFLLKGALLYTLWYDMPHRATRKADLLGFGDAVTPAPVESVYPVLLNDLPAPKLRAYPTYTVIAEKLHAIILLGTTNSRLKDHFDLSVLRERENLDTDLRAQAIKATFERRGMSVPDAVPIGLTDEFARDSSRQSLWLVFLKKNELLPEPLPATTGAGSDHPLAHAECAWIPRTVCCLEVKTPNRERLGVNCWWEEEDQKNTASC